MIEFRGCPLLVHIVGHHPGSVQPAPRPWPTSSTALTTGCFCICRISTLTLGDFSEITYTQWEAFLALHHRVPMLVYAPADARHGQAQALTDTFAQRIHLERLAVANKRPEDPVLDEAEFVGKILADVHRHFGIEVPTAAPRIALLKWVARIPDDFDAYFRALWAAGYGKEQIPAAEVDTLAKKVRALMGDSSRIMDKLPDMFEQTAPSPREKLCFAEDLPAFGRGVRSLLRGLQASHERQRVCRRR